MIEYVYSGKAIDCPSTLETYIRLNYSTLDPKLITVVSDFSTNQTILYFNASLTSTETQYLDQLLPVFTCDLNFTDPNLTSAPTQPPQINVEDSLCTFDFMYHGSISGSRWLFTYFPVYSCQVGHLIPYRMKLVSITFSTYRISNVAILLYKKPATSSSTSLLLTSLFLGMYHGYINNLAEKNIILDKGERLLAFAQKIKTASEANYLLTQGNTISVGTFANTHYHPYRVYVRCYFQIIENNNENAIITYR